MRTLSQDGTRPDMTVDVGRMESPNTQADTVKTIILFYTKGRIPTTDTSVHVLKHLEQMLSNILRLEAHF